MPFFKKPFDVVFYYPQHFNRSTDGTNPFFDPIIKICKENNLSFLVIEEPDRSSANPRSKNTHKFDFWFYTIILLRKNIPLFFFKKAAKKEEFIGRIISILTFNFFKSDCYITISNSMINVLPGLSRKAKVYDLQHGIIYSWHWGYFDENGVLNDNLRDDRIRFLVYGSGVKKIFYKENAFLKLNDEPKVVVIGSSVTVPKTISCIRTNNTVVYTLQMVAELSEDELSNQKSKLQSFLENSKDLFTSNKLQLYLKQHPRFNNAIDLNDVLDSYPFVTITDETIDQLIPKAMLHITQSSTSIFEFGLAGIPTYIIPNDTGYKIFVKEFKYPHKNLELKDIISLFANNQQMYFEFCGNIEKWASTFYEAFNKKAVIDIIKHGKN